MITVLTGDNDFELTRAVESVMANFEGTPERVDGSELELRQLPDLLMGATLFASKRLVIIKDLSLNKAVWADLGEWLPRVTDDIHLVLVESKLDKRTKTYKALQKAADIKEFSLWTDRDVAEAGRWAIHEAKRLGFTLDTKSTQALLSRVGLDQWLLSQALEKLAFADEVNEETVMEIVDASPTENVFLLFETALSGDAEGVSEMIATLSLGEDPYRLFGLLSGQAFQLAALTTTDKPAAEVAKDLGAHPFALSKLTAHARRRGRGGARKIIAAFAEADSGMKTSVADPWLLIERALIKVAQS